MDDLMDAILERVTQLRIAKGKNEKEVTIEAGISRSTFSDWKSNKGKPKIPVLVKFANYFDVSLDYLILGKESDVPVIQGVTGVDEELLRKFHALTPDLQDRLMSYADGLLAAMPQKDDELGEKLSG